MEQRLLGLIEAIYSAASSPDEWPAVAQQIQALIGGHSVHLAMSDPTRKRINCIYSNSLSNDETRYYQQHIAHRDELTGIFDRAQAGSAFLLNDYYQPQQLSEMACYTEFYDNVGLNDFAASYFYRDQAVHGWCTVARSKTDRPFSDQQRNMLKALTPHLAQATRISLQLASAHQMSRNHQESLEQLPLAIILLSADAAVINHNERATPFLQRGEHNHWQLTLPCPRTQQQLQDVLKAMQTQAEHPGCCMAVEYAEQQHTIIVTPWRNSAAQTDWLQAQPTAMVMINSAKQVLPADWLRQRYKLSKAEARTLNHLLTGTNAGQIADMLFVTTHTIRFHIKNLLLKTDCTSQTQMVAKVLQDFSGLY